MTTTTISSIATRANRETRELTLALAMSAGVTSAIIGMGIVAHIRPYASPLACWGLVGAGILGTHLAARNVAWGWLLLVSLQPMWIAYAVSTEQYVKQVWDGYRAFGADMPMIDYTARWLLDHLPPESEPRLVHNDFRNGNLMVTPQGIVAVLDWELAHLGDPVRDLGWICTRSWRFGRHELAVGGFGRLEELLDGYESVSGRRVDTEHVRFWEVFGSFWWASMSLTMAVVWREGPDRTVERPAVARRSSECQVDSANLIIPGPVELLDEEKVHSSVSMPRVDELLVSVREFLRQDARKALEGRNAFMALVASNSLDIVHRELTLGPAHLRAEHERLKAFFGSEEALEELRARLTQGLREGVIALESPGLAEHLRTTAANQLAIDQPRYAGLAVALAVGEVSQAGTTQTHDTQTHDREENS